MISYLVDLQSNPTVLDNNRQSQVSALDRCAKETKCLATRSNDMYKFPSKLVEAHPLDVLKAGL